MSTVAPIATENLRPLLARKSGWAERYLLFLGLVLLGYALDGRGFAYLGYPPLYIGEFTMVIGMGVLVCTPGWSRLFQSPPMLALVPLFLLGALHTALDFPTYGVDAIRDAAIYYYAIFAIIVAGLIINDSRRLMLIISMYRRFIPIFLIGIPIVAIVYRFFWNSLPRWPGGDIPMIQEKEGDVMVQLAGIFAFWTAGMVGVVSLGWAALLAANAAVLGVVDRAGLLSFGTAVGIGMVRSPRSALAWRMIGAVVAALVLLWASGLRIEVPGGKGRELSFEQIVLNVTSITGSSGREGMDSTKEWRLDWWQDIVADTVYGRHFWWGLGFGVNLADEYGYQVLADHSLRSPHDAHMTILARMGVPGLALWALALFTWIFYIGRAFLRARASRDRGWESIFFFLAVFWIAFLINASFDVYLEGPMGGIWFWCIVGLGAGALWVYERHPETLYQS